ncbi:RteC domain-containing protein [Dinghuibacter silviterrae]|uniref:RteC protein n=1 Tax=Dinghuibacter silviterrae TaxID=1539049 RepID=A0A4R8DRA3_9BACT|nr:RteC domain-containing protein [Dinghuibacter silviterrae]TDX00499.1 RteC protein [Dinghuibacter silviterrae]
MGEFFEEIRQSINTQLESVERTAGSMLEQSKLAIPAIRQHIERLREHVLRDGFADPSDEVTFFRNELPHFYKHLIFYRHVYFIETRRPVVKEEEALFLEQERAALQLHFEKYREFYTYFRSGETFLDEKLFVRGNEDLLFTIEEYTDVIDSRFCTSHSYLVARMHADNMILAYLNELETGDKLVLHQSHEPITWTDPKVGLIELCYALYSKGAVNNGKAHLKDIIKGVEYIFNITLGNYTAVIQQNIRIRKKTRMAYLADLIKFTESHMDDQDEHPQYK